MLRGGIPLSIALITISGGFNSDVKEKLLEQIIRDEGIEYKPYRCTVDKITIGVGRNLDDVGINHDEAMMLLHSDITRCVDDLNSNVPLIVKLSEPRIAVLINMTFNLGITRLLKFKNMIAALEKGEYIIASKEMLDSKWARQVPNRARRLAIQMETGKWID